MNIIICDDRNEDALSLKQIILTALPDAQTEVFFTGQDTLDYIDSGKLPDVCFLDILMPEVDGIALAVKIREKGYDFPIIFMTTSNEYASQSYKVSAYSYLIKPPRQKEVSDVLEKLQSELESADKAGFMVEVKREKFFMRFANISHIEVIGHNLYYRLKNGEEIKEAGRFVDAASKLQEDARFAQCHRSFLINMDYVYKIQGNTVIMRCGRNIPISRSHARFCEKYIEYLLGKRK